MYDFQAKESCMYKGAELSNSGAIRSSGRRKACEAMSYKRGEREGGKEGGREGGREGRREGGGRR